MNIQIQSAEQLAPQLGSQGSDFEKRLATLTAHYETSTAELGKVGKLQERVVVLEIGAKDLRVMLDEHDEVANKQVTENKKLKGEVGKAQALIDSIEVRVYRRAQCLAYKLISIHLFT